MPDPPEVAVARAPEGDAQSGTVVLCEFCEGWLSERITDGTLATELRVSTEGDPVERLHEHLVRFGFTVELSDNSHDPRVPSDDLNDHSWGTYTTRAVRMFARHPAVADEPAEILEDVDGTSVTAEIAAKIQAWCRRGTVSPANYWELPTLRLASGDLDAVGDDLDTTSGEQTALHDYVSQLQADLSATGFAPHQDDICGIERLPPVSRRKRGLYFVAPAVERVHPDRDLQDVRYLVEKFQRQAKWYWRMSADGTHQSDITSDDPTYYAGEVNGVVDAATATALHAWVAGNLHMVMAKYPLTILNWPPNGGEPIRNTAGSARLRSDAADAWLAAATDVFARGGTLEGGYASSPRPYTVGQMSSGSANSGYSWHYSGLAIDISEAFRIMGHRSRQRYGLAADGDRFRIWCRVEPQPPAPSSSAEPAAPEPDPLMRYSDRDAPLQFLDGSAHEFAAPDGWYLDLSAVMEAHGLMRIRRHSDWATNARAWEWWHYQFQPELPPGAEEDLGFGEYVQIFGVHEFKLRNQHDGWPNHEDIRHRPG
jgi:hypothetical protein